LTKGKKPCTNRVLSPGKYCRYHKTQNLTYQEKVITNRPIIPVPAKVSETEKEFTGDCSICLCEIEEKEGSLLVCGHKFHTDCLQRVEKAECPVCRAPLESEDIKIDVQQIKDREEKEKIEQIMKTIQSDRELAQEINDREDFHQHTAPQNDLFFQVLHDSILTAQNDADVLFKILLEETALQDQMSEYEMMFQVLENSFRTAEQEENEILDRVITNSRKRGIDKNEYFDWLDNEVFQGQDRVVITLKCC
jgi:hypothetical protein